MMIYDDLHFAVDIVWGLNSAANLDVMNPAQLQPGVEKGHLFLDFLGH